MRIDAANLIAAQAARPVTKAQPPVPSGRKAEFEPLHIPKAETEAPGAKPATAAAPARRPGSQVDITV